jgi:hypothetical protein
MHRGLQFSAAALAAVLAIYFIVSYGFDAVVRQSVEQWQLENPAHAAPHHP